MKKLTINSSLKTLFLRVSSVNKTEKGDVIYTYDDFKKMVNEFVDRYPKTSYAYIQHDKDTSPDGPVGLHFHVYMNFNGSPVKFKYIKEAFPFGDIKESRSKNACVQYLIHKNNPEKFQYEKTEIIHNMEQDKFEAMFINDRKVSKLSDEDELVQVLNDIADMKIRRFNFSEHVNVELYSKYKTRIDNAFKYRDMLYLQDKSREIDVWFVAGDGGNGKTTIAKKYAEKQFNGVCISSSSNDPMQDYLDEDVLILDDLRDNDFSFQDLLKILDNHTKSSIKSRYNNKIFMGKLIIITSYKDLDNWYASVPLEARAQLYRRISQYVKVDDENVSFFYMDKHGNKKKFLQFKNPVKEILKQERQKLIDNKNDLATNIISSFSEFLSPETENELYNSIITDDSLIEFFEENEELPF